MIDEKKLNGKFGAQKDSIKDLGTAVNLLSVYGEDCLLCVHPEIREEAYKHFKDKTLPDPNTSN